MVLGSFCSLFGGSFRIFAKQKKFFMAFAIRIWNSQKVRQQQNCSNSRAPLFKGCSREHKLYDETDAQCLKITKKDSILQSKRAKRSIWRYVSSKKSEVYRLSP